MKNLMCKSCSECKLGLQDSSTSSVSLGCTSSYTSSSSSVGHLSFHIVYICEYVFNTFEACLPRSYSYRNIVHCGTPCYTHHVGLQIRHRKLHCYVGGERRCNTLQNIPPSGSTAAHNEACSVLSPAAAGPDPFLSFSCRTPSWPLNEFR